MPDRERARGIFYTWVESIGLDSNGYGTLFMRPTKPALIYWRARNLRVGQLLLGHDKLESIARYLGSSLPEANGLAPPSVRRQKFVAPHSGRQQPGSRLPRATATT